MDWLKVQIKTTEIGAEVVTGVLLANNVTSMEIINPRERVKHLNEAAATWDYAEESLFDVGDNEIYVIFYVARGADGTEAGGENGTEADSAEAEGKNGMALIRSIEKALACLASELDGLGALELKVESADDSDWLNEWKKHFKPFNVGRVKIVPEWEDVSPCEGEIVFKVDPGSAFGTGQHQTTKLCILALQEQLQGRLLEQEQAHLQEQSKKGVAMLDIGCGSGILSIIGLLLGARSVVACDIDPVGAISATKKNAALNKIEPSRLKVLAGDVLSDEGLRREIGGEIDGVGQARREISGESSGGYQVIVANIVADVIIELLPFVKEQLAADGIFIASGIINERAEEVLAAFGDSGLRVVEEMEHEGWCAVVARKK
ncbi:MAG: 50S ribosomal protein L11 methyltransferase [Defluviitaleaceae bacterium]|nr:50S ribosomal protein L11 methyltransferase [Defluviitaleaceae bacterium]